jgi:hypothetical protein
MVSRIGKSLLLLLALILATTGIVYAEEDTPQKRLRFLGEITSVDPQTHTFSLHSRSDEDLRFSTTEETQFRSRDGSIQSLEDLSPGMKALVVAYRGEGGALIASIIAAGEVGDIEDIRHYKGIIASVDLESNSFGLHMEDGRNQRFVVGDRTRYKSRDGSINGLEDLEAGMVAHVAAIERENQAPFALMVAAGKTVEKPERFRVHGKISAINLDRQTFDVVAKDGNVQTFQVVERTKFRSRDGSIVELADLKEGMHTLVVAVNESEGASIALLVAAADLSENPGLSRLDVRAIGKITSIGDQAFTIQTTSQGRLTFTVHESTVYRSRKGNVNGFEDLSEGLFVAVGGKSTAEGNNVAFIVLAGQESQGSNRSRNESSNSVQSQLSVP